ncbi:MAG: hypothetical protein QXU75_03190 [Candidatus Methanomethylicaceae archaeon]
MVDSTFQTCGNVFNPPFSNVSTVNTEEKAEPGVRISVRFAIDNIEVSMEKHCNQSEMVDAIVSLAKTILDKQEDIAAAFSGLNLTKKPTRHISPSTDPYDKLSEALNIDQENLKKIFYFEADKVYLTCKRDMFGERGGGEKAALALLYAYKYGLGKQPTYNEFNEAYEKMRFKPHTFGKRVKGNLQRAGKISETQDGRLSIEPTAIPEAAKIIKEIASKLSDELR